MRNYVKVKVSDLPTTIVEQRQLSDNFWKEHILSYLQTYYKETSNDEIAKIIEREEKKKQAKIETGIKKHIKKWFRNNFKFYNEGFILNDEPSSEGSIEGFYDFKIEHSFWNFTKTYFPFECKNLGKSTLLNEYVFIETKDRIDGGMYRYIIDKYAVNQTFGGMIGFVIHKTEKPIIEQLIKKIEKKYTSIETGKLSGNKIVKNSIFGNKNSFNSIHRKTNSEKEFVIHHIIMDFVNDIVEESIFR